MCGTTPFKKKKKKKEAVFLVTSAASENALHLSLAVVGYVSLPASLFSAACQCGK